MGSGSSRLVLHAWVFDHSAMLDRHATNGFFGLMKWGETRFSAYEKEARTGDMRDMAMDCSAPHS
jgi:hypothetical protein